MICYAVKDEKSGAFLSPFFIRHLADALRSLSRLCNDPENGLCRFAEDYSLWKIAEFDDGTGSITPDFHHEANLISLRTINLVDYSAMKGGSNAKS